MSCWNRWRWYSGPDRLYRDTENGVISGICAGLAEYLGVKIVLMRVAAVVALCFLVFPVLIAYGVLTFVLPRRPRSSFTQRTGYADREERRTDRDERRADRDQRRAERRARRAERRYGMGPAPAGEPDMPRPSGESLRSLLDKFGTLEDRLAHMETEVTSSDFELKRKFRDIGG